MNRPAWVPAAWYLAVGGVTALGYFLVAALLHRQWGWGLVGANLAAICCMHPFSYLGHRYLTFQYSGPWLRSALRFGTVAVVSTLVSLGLTVSQSSAGLDPLVALASNCILIPAITLALYKWWVFGRQRGHEGPAGRNV